MKVESEKKKKYYDFLFSTHWLGFRPIWCCLHIFIIKSIKMKVESEKILCYRSNK